jgi:hypothetical protein
MYWRKTCKAVWQHHNITREKTFTNMADDLLHTRRFAQTKKGRIRIKKRLPDNPANGWRSSHQLHLYFYRVL